jgi:hypothetical protein
MMMTNLQFELSADGRPGQRASSGASRGMGTGGPSKYASNKGPNSFDASAVLLRRANIAVTVPSAAKTAHLRSGTGIRLGDTHRRSGVCPAPLVSSGGRMRVAGALPFIAILKPATLADIGRRLRSSEDPTQLTHASVAYIRASFGVGGIVPERYQSGYLPDSGEDARCER